MIRFAMILDASQFFSSASLIILLRLGKQIGHLTSPRLFTYSTLTEISSFQGSAGTGVVPKPVKKVVAKKASVGAAAKPSKTVPEKVAAPQVKKAQQKSDAAVSKGKTLTS